MDDANDDVCALCEAKAGTNSAAGSAGDGDSLSKKAVVIGNFSARTHLLYKTCRPKFAAEFGGASAHVRHVKPLRGACALCAEYVKPIVNRRRSPLAIGIGPLLVFFRMRDRARSVHR